MDIQLNTLLVALMFITILSMGIGNILVALAGTFNHATPSRRDKVHVGWILLILIVHFNLFWHTKAILDVENWEFAGFLLTIAGPVLMFFATSILLTEPPEDFQPNLNSFFVNLGRRFFLMLAILQAWVVGVGISLSEAFVPSDIVNVCLMILALVLAFTTSEKIQVFGIFVAWGLVLFSGVIRWVG